MFSQKSSTDDLGKDYNPLKKKYHPIEDSFWKHNEKVPYLACAKTFEAIEATSGRLESIRALSNFLRSVIILSPQDLLACIYLSLNCIAPAYEAKELGIGDSVLMKALAQATGKNVDKIKAELQDKGDLGLIAESARCKQRTMFTAAKLTVSVVFQRLKEIANMSGHSAQNKKVDKIQSLLVACRLCEARYLVRSLSGKLRIGMAEQSVLQALAQALAQSPPSSVYPPEIIDASEGLSEEKWKRKVDTTALLIKTTFCECPNFDRIIDAILTHGLEALSTHCSITPGVPVKPMLAHPSKGVQEVFKRFDDADFTCEYKYDGERAQIHLWKNTSGEIQVKIYSRNQEDNTSKYPDLVKLIPNVLASGEMCKDGGVQSCILDSEAVAWDRVRKQILPFQVLTTRKRKNANESEITVQVCIHAFDVLYLNGVSLISQSLRHRRQLLRSSFVPIEGEFVFAAYLDCSDTNTVAEFLEESVKGNCEGLMVKTLDKNASYEIAKRSHNWLKLKKDYLEGIGDTLDLVVLGAYHGAGKRVGKYGGFLLACYDNDNEEYQTICKIGTGFSDAALDTHYSFLQNHIIDKPKSYYSYDASLLPDVWFEALQVWEVKAADLSISPVYKAGIGIVSADKGISLRFPRFLRIREDKSAEDATTSKQVSDMYMNQEQVKNQEISKEQTTVRTKKGSRSPSPAAIKAGKSVSPTALKNNDKENATDSNSENEYY